MAQIHPWGKIDWLTNKVGHRNWTGILCSSFEPRCLAVADWLSKNSTNNQFCLKISDPENRFTSQVLSSTNDHEKIIKNLFGARLDLINAELLSEPSVWYNFSHLVGATPDLSLMLDISGMPKRVFLFLVKQFLSSKNVKDLVVCYTRPEGYKEGQLTEDALPPSPIPGFSRISNYIGDPTTIVSVGYMAFNLGDLLEQQRGRTAKFLFPFPPGSPGFRRSWRLLHDLSQGMDLQTEIKRINSMDMFSALDWLKDIKQGTSGNIDMIPIGPKPHALAMGLAFPFMGDSAEISYSQPRLYHPDYSFGILKDEFGNADITAYCLRRDFVNFV